MLSGLSLLMVNSIGFSRQAIWFVFTFLCKVFLGVLSSKYGPCLTSEITQNLAILYHSPAPQIVYTCVCVYIQDWNKISTTLDYHFLREQKNLRKICNYWGGGEMKHGYAYRRSKSNRILFYVFGFTLFLSPWLDSQTAYIIFLISISSIQQSHYGCQLQAETFPELMWKVGFGEGGLSRYHAIDSTL